jgi:phosphoglycerol transferase
VFAAMLVPQIRGYNRLSIVIGFYAILALLLVAQTLVEWVPRTAWRRGLTATLTVLLLLCGLVSQVPRTVRPEFDALARRFATDREFLKRVEAVLPTGARVFQLPVLGMPDQGQHRMSQFAHLRGYLHTHGPRWSYGAIAGREIDRWQREIAAKPVEAMVASLREARFSGLYIDRFGFPDQAQRLEGRLRDLLEREPIVSGDRRFLFFDLRDNHASGGVP